MKKTLLFFVGVLVSISSYSQGVLSVFKDWSTTAGTQAFYQRSVTYVDGSGNVYIAGATLNGSGNYDILLVKNNSSGVEQWNVQYNGAGNGHDVAVGLKVDASGNVYITGVVTTATNVDMVTIKYNSSGTQQWLSTYDGTGSLYDCGSDIATDASGNVYVCGSSYNASGNLDYVTIKYNSSGTQQWATLYAHSSNLDDAPVRISVRTTMFGTTLTVLGAVQTGATAYSFGVIKYNYLTGAQLTATITSGGSSGIDQVFDMAVDTSGNTYIAGGLPVTSQGYNTCIIKLNSSLAIQWQSTYNGVDSLDDMATGIMVNDATGNVYFTGYTTSSTEGKNFLTVKYNSSGTQQWAQTYNDTLNGDDIANGIIIDASDNVYVTGYDSTAINGTDYYTIKYDSGGTEIWNIREDGDAHRSDRATNIALVGTNIAVTGASQKADNTYEYKTIKYIEHNVITPTDYNTEDPQNGFLFYENKGQLIATDTTLVPTIKYYTENSYPLLYFKDNSYSMVFAHIDTVPATQDTLHRIDVTFTQVNSNAKTYSLEEKPEYLNYFLAHCPEGVTEIFGNQRLVTTNLYTNIDMISYSNRYGFKYYFIIKPGAIPATVKMEYTGASSFNLDGTTNVLTINSSIGSVAFDRPTVYQLNSSNVIVPITAWTADWQTNGASNKYKFNTGTYDSTKTLVIQVDMGNAAHASASAIGNLEHSTYYGGTVSDFNNDIRTDNAGNVYTAGWTQSTNFPVLAGIYSALLGVSDATVVKFDNAMVRLWGTYFGGTGDEEGTGVAVFASGSVHFVGQTTSTNMPHPLVPVAGAMNDFTFGGGSQPDAFVAKLNATGTTLMWATYVGGSGNERFMKIKADGLGNFYCVGQGNTSSPLKSKTGAYNNSSTGNAYITKFNSSDTLVWASLISGASRIDDFAANGAGENCLTALANASGFPIVTPAGGYMDNTLGGIDIGIMKLNTSDTIYWSTYFGGSVAEFSRGLCLDGFDNMYLTGETYSSNFPYYYPGGSAYCDSALGGASDVYFARFSKNGKRTWASYYGGTLHNDAGTAVACDALNNVYFAGYTSSTNFPMHTLASGYNQGSTSSASAPDATIVSFNSDLQRLWSTYYSGLSNDAPFGIIAYQSSKLYITGSTYSQNTIFPLADLGSGAWYRDTLNNGTNNTLYNDAFIARFDLTPIVVLGVNENGNSGNTSMIVYPNPSSGNATLNITLDKQTDLIISVFSTLGQIVYEKQLKNKIGVINENVDLSNVANGVYFISVNTDTEKMSAKIIKQ